MQQAPAEYAAPQPQALATGLDGLGVQGGAAPEASLGQHQEPAALAAPGLPFIKPVDAAGLVAASLNIAPAALQLPAAVASSPAGGGAADSATVPPLPKPRESMMGGRDKWRRDVNLEHLRRQQQQFAHDREWEQVCGVGGAAEGGGGVGQPALRSCPRPGEPAAAQRLHAGMAKPRNPLPPRGTRTHT